MTQHSFNISLPSNPSFISDKSGPWLNGWTDLVSNLNILPNCIKLVDVGGNGNYKLVIVDMTGRLVCFNGTNIEWETRVPDLVILGLSYIYTE